MVLQQNCDEIDINFKKHILTNQITYVLITVTQEALSKYLHVSVSMAFRQHFTEITIKNVWQSIEWKIRLVFTTVAIKAMLKYLEKSVTENVSDDATRELHQYISRVKQQPEVRKGYMRFEEIIASERKEAAEEAAINIYVQNIMELLEDIGIVPDELCEN